MKFMNVLIQISSYGEDLSYIALFTLGYARTIDWSFDL